MKTHTHTEKLMKVALVFRCAQNKNNNNNKTTAATTTTTTKQTQW
jgi:hypothetical protein